MEYGAIDLHMKKRGVGIVDETGAVVVRDRITTSREAFAALFGHLREPMEMRKSTERIATFPQASLWNSAS